MKKIYKIIIIVILIVMLAGVGVFFYVDSMIKAPGGNREITFTVETNNTPMTIFERLEADGMIKDHTIAYYYTRIFLNPDFKAGDYLINSDMPLSEIVSYLSDDDNALLDTVTITFPEGDWLKDYAEKIAEVTDVTSEELLNYWNDEAVIRGYMEDYPFLTEEIFNEGVRYYLEGYLFPDTYEFYRDTDVSEITERFLDRTLEVYNEHRASFENSDLSTHEIFTLASIVQYEAGNKEDMELVASVFLNRLAIDMPLQSSVTVCYAMDIDKENDSWTVCEYNPDFDSPYNTYMYNGLTPGPILNPGEDAIMAVIEPVTSDYLYFMADVCGDGTVYYAVDYAEHQANVERYNTCY